MVPKQTGATLGKRYHLYQNREWTQLFSISYRRLFQANYGLQVGQPYEDLTLQRSAGYGH